MQPKTIYLLLGLVGAVMEYWVFVPWLFNAQASPALFIDQLFARDQHILCA